MCCALLCNLLDSALLSPVLQINVEYENIEEGETIARTFADYWVVCRKSGHRSFFVILNQKNANFAEINGWLC